MSRYHSYVSSAVKAIEKYNGSEPFAAFLKKFFSADKKYGSKDRKMISELCYGFFRCSHAFSSDTTEEKIIKARFLLQHESDALLAMIHPVYNDRVKDTMEQKCTLINVSTSAIFPSRDSLSEQIDHSAYFISLLQQPDTFLRIRKDIKKVTGILEKAAIPFSIENDTALRLSHSVKLDDVLKINRDVVVQDISSQQVLNVLKPELFSDTIDVWDCCAASGGKSLLLHDQLNGKIRLSVSDVREKIILNLKNRMQEARVPLYKAFVADAINFDSEEPYDLIICDAPCTGSGTWGRTPEQLRYFKNAEIEKYATLQRGIIQKTWEALKPGGYYCYITCSVFSKENELNQALIESLGSKTIHAQYHVGYTKKADTLFSALFQKLIP